MGSDRTRPARRLKQAIVSLALLSALGACSVTDSVSGRVVGIDGDLTTLRSVTLVTADGDRLTFAVNEDTDYGHFDPGHFNEHLLNAQPIIVRFLDDGGVLVAVEFTEP